MGVVDEKTIRLLAREFGSPLLIFDEKTLQEKYTSLKKALDTFYPHYRIAYSVKTNYIPALIRILKDCGTNAEVVSGFEYWLAKKIGFERHQIVFNGPEKTAGDMHDIVLGGGLLNLSSFGEIEIFSSIDFKNQPIEVGVRVNTNVRSFSQKRFGFNIESGEVYRAIARIKEKQPTSRVVGLHTHLGMMVMRPENFTKTARLLASCAKVIEKKWGSHIKFLDFGGGFSVPGARSRSRITWDVPNIKEYIKHIATVLNEVFPQDKPTLIVEPGRYLIDEAGIFLTTVIDSKFVPIYGKYPVFFEKIIQRLFPSFKELALFQVVTINSNSASVLKAPSDQKHLTILKVQNKKRGNTYPSYIVGNSCMTKDYLTNRVMLSTVQKGDNVLFSNAGAYTISMSEQFIHPRPRAVLLRVDGSVKEIQRKEEYEDMIQLAITS